MLDSNSYIDLKYSSLYKCDVCKTAFISPFTLATHQLYSCPVTCAFVLEDSAPESTKTCSEDEPESSDDEGKLKIVEKTSKGRVNRCSHKKNLRIKKVSKNCASTSKSLKSTVKEASNQLNDVPGKELGKNSKSSTCKRNDIPRSTTSKTKPNPLKTRHSDQEIKTPLKVLLKIEGSAENAALPGKTVNVVKLASFSTKNIGNPKQSRIVAISEHLATQETSEDNACNSCASNDVLKNKQEFAVGTGEEKNNVVALKHGEFNTI